VSLNLSFQVGVVLDGKWIYTDKEYEQVATRFLDIVGWDLFLYDDWLYGGAHWRSVPKIRQTLIELRNDLTIALRCAREDERTVCTVMMKFSGNVLKLTSRLKNLPEKLTESMSLARQKNCISPKYKVDIETTSRIRRAYQNMLDSGEGYGAQSRLAQHYNVSRATVQKILKN
jgi:hypothetical protein